MWLKWKPPLLFILFFALAIMASCSRDPNQEAQGYIEGRYTYIATSVSGMLVQLLVERGTLVKRGQMLAVLESEPESDVYEAALQSLKESIAARDAIQANLAYAKITYERYKILVPKKAIQQSQLDNAQSIYNSTLAQLAQSNANIAETSASAAEAKWRAQQKILYAPVDAMVFDTYYRIGEYTEAKQAILSLLAPTDIKVIFYVSELDLGAIKLSDKITVNCDGCQKTYTGTITFISPTAEYTPPVIFSTETNEKLIYRIEAHFKTQEALHLHPGQPVTVMYRRHE